MNKLEQYWGLAPNNKRTLVDIFTYPPKPLRHDFDLLDLTGRLVLSVIMFYYLLITRPLSFGLLYSYRYFVREYTPLFGIFVFVFTPIFPIAFLLPITLLLRVKEMFKASWMTKGPGSIFFSRPQGFVNSILWDMWLFMGIFTSSYIMTGTNRTAMKHIEYDAVANKWFWRDVFKKGGVFYPTKIGSFQNGKLEVNLKKVKKEDKIIIKEPDSYLGIGDLTLTKGYDFQNKQDLKDLCLKTYGNDKEAYIAPLIRCDKKYGVHQLDILTAKMKDGTIQVLRVLYWGDCTGNTSHSATTGYLVDPITETVVSAATWYSPSYLNQKTNMVGQKMPGVKKACAECIKLHKIAMSKANWLGIIGWDLAFTNKNMIVHFEGNYAISRLRRHCFSSFAAMYRTLAEFAPVFGQGCVPTGL